MASPKEQIETLNLLVKTDGPRATINGEKAISEKGVEEEEERDRGVVTRELTHMAIKDGKSSRMGRSNKSSVAEMVEMKGMPKYS